MVRRSARSAVTASHCTSVPRPGALQPGRGVGWGGVAGDLDPLFFFGMPWDRLAFPDVMAGRLAGDSRREFSVLCSLGVWNPLLLCAAVGCAPLRLRCWDFNNWEEFDSLLRAVMARGILYDASTDTSQESNGDDHEDNGNYDNADNNR